MESNIIPVNSGEKMSIRVDCLDPATGLPIDVSNYINFYFEVNDKRGNNVLKKELNNGITFLTDGTDGALLVELNESETHNLKDVYRYIFSYRNTENVLKIPIKSYITFYGENML